MELRPTILYVEDEAMIAMAITDVLEEAGFEVDHAPDGASALAKLKDDPHKYVALVTDVRLPNGIQGWDIGVHARELNPQVPVVYVSGDSAGDWSARGVPKSVMLQKPFANAQLITAVATLVNDAGEDSDVGDES